MQLKSSKHIVFNVFFYNKHRKMNQKCVFIMRTTVCTDLQRKDAEEEAVCPPGWSCTQKHPDQPLSSDSQPPPAPLSDLLLLFESIWSRSAARIHKARRIQMTSWSRENRPIAARGRDPLGTALANRSEGFEKSNSGRILIGWSAARRVFSSLNSGRCRVSSRNAVWLSVKRDAPVLMFYKV